MTQPFANDEIKAAFAVEDPKARAGMLALRDLILVTAARLPQVGPVEEALRWGQPSYLTPETKSGSTLRLGQPKGGCFALFVHCQSTLIPDYLQAFPAWDRVEGTRALLFDDVSEIDPIRHGWLVERALTYHLHKTAKKQASGK